MSSTIYALSSAEGRAAIAIIRVSGPRSLYSIERLTGLPAPISQRLVLRTIKCPKSNKTIDKGLVVFFQGPNSATGEDLVEFHVHGGRAIIQAMLDALANLSELRLAEPGEFARRSFDNRKIDLTTAEGIADLIEAETRSQHYQAQMQAEGGLADLYDSWRKMLLEAQALVEAAIDFSDETDVSGNSYQRALDIVQTLVETLTEHLKSARAGEIIRFGFHVAIAGPPNAGKSSLLNVMAKRDIAIVSDEPGTTRDVIEARLDLDGFLVVISDTAGIRAPSSKIEQEGINRALERAYAADLILWIQDSTSKQVVDIPDDISGKNILNIVNKADLIDRYMPHHITEKSILISAKTGIGLDDLTSFISAAARHATYTANQVIPTNARHKQHLSNVKEQLNKFFNNDIAGLDLSAEDLRLAATELGRLTGRIDVEDILDQIFSRFCIGK
ncbi:MAG: tRNA uridine-5-carboxymethylaminomethyl(34) synthesis GTPase MnmE [Hyphomicrobiaceae bacterium]|nr:tRNA uridine-5-carboxymethylaminomethyl(34) synthesis GTPase MnmE [Hyphomicrobiaceae bacterium]